MSRGGPLKLLGGSVGGWVALRVGLVALAPGAAVLPVATGVLPGFPPQPIARLPERVAAVVPVRVAILPPSPRWTAAPPAARRATVTIAPVQILVPALPQGDVAALMLAAYQPQGAPFRRADADAAEAFARPPSLEGDPLPGRWSAQAWLFARAQGGKRGFAPGGQLGGSQAGLRIVRRLGRHFAVAARVSVATGDPASAEAAAGLDWLPFGAAVPFRASIERRVALGPHARNAWSAYAAGGFYSQVASATIVDGYAQAGVVGANRRDFFADGGVRAGRQVRVGPAEQLTLGAGAWGAAQPGVERLDIGPRAALSLPLGRQATGVLALEGRMRVAGGAAPGTGLALTLATDF